MVNDILIFVAGCTASFIVGYLIHTPPDKAPVLVAKMGVATEAKTSIEYKKKTSKTDADIETNIGKNILKVSLNGVTQEVHKTDTEKFVLDENKISLEQQSKTTIDIKTETTDLTRKWRIGVGYSNHGWSTQVNFPVYGYVGGFTYFDQTTASLGLSLAF